MRFLSESHRYSAKPFRFRVAISSSVIIFNLEIAIDLMWIDENPIIHLVGTEINYQDMVLLLIKSTGAVWHVFFQA